MLGTLLGGGQRMERLVDGAPVTETAWEAPDAVKTASSH